MPFAIGHEREELEAELEGQKLLDIDHPAGPFGIKLVICIYSTRCIWEEVGSYWNQRDSQRSSSGSELSKGGSTRTQSWALRSTGRVNSDGKIVGEGFHPKAGQPHAEVFALRDAGDLADDGTPYVSLEPCNHYGRTPPCTEALIKARVKKVVVGMVDPNPIVALKGVDRLQDAGIDVTVGIEEELCKKLNEAYIHQMLTGKPFVTLRYSLLVNGHLLDQLGEEVAESGGYYSQLLQEYDAIILASTSLTQKYSFPASKELGANQPLQIVTAKSCSSPFRIS